MASMVSSTGQSTWRRRDARRQPEEEPEVSRLRSRGRAEVSRLSRIYARCAPTFGGRHGTRRADQGGVVAQVISPQAFRRRKGGGDPPPFLSALALDTKDYLCCYTAVAPAAASLRLGLGSLLPGHLLDCRRIAAAAAGARYLLGPSHDLLGTFGHLHVLLLTRLQTLARRCLWWLRDN